MVPYAPFGAPPDNRLRFGHVLDPDEREATEQGLVGWAVESGTKELLVETNVVELQLKPGTESALVEQTRRVLLRRILASHDFEGSDQARKEGVDALLGRWDSDVRPTLDARVATFFETEYLAAVRRTPPGASLVTKPDEYWRIRNAPFLHFVSLGRWGATAKVGSPPSGNLVVADVFNFGSWATVWVSVVGHPDWYYVMSDTAFIATDPLVGQVARQVADKTKFAGEIMPGLLTIAGFTLGLSARVAFIIASIALEELAEEMRRETRGEPHRSASDIATSGLEKVVLAKILGKLFDAETSALAKATPEVERIAERAVPRAIPAVRRELVESEGPAVAAALRTGAGRVVVDPTLRAEGYVVEVMVIVESRGHTYLRRADGTWCRLSNKICGLDLGADVAEATWSALGKELGATPGAAPTGWTLPGKWRQAKTEAFHLIFGSKTLPDINRPGRVRLTLGHIVEKSTGGTHSLDNLMPQLNAVNVKLSGIYARKPFRLRLPSGEEQVLTHLNGKPIVGSLREAFESGVFDMAEQRAISDYLTHLVIAENPAFEKELAELVRKVPNLAELAERAD
jgi:hypothetical protein